MELKINTIALRENNVSLAEALCLIAIDAGYNMGDIKEALLKIRRHGYVGEWYNAGGKLIGYNMVDSGTKLLNNILIKGAKNKEEQIKELATNLKALWPKGKRPGTNLYWAESVPLISIRLQQFFVKYGEYNLDDVYIAAKKYVESFASDTSYMRSLRYFIFRDRGVTHDVTYDSPLLDILEDMKNGEDNLVNNDWNQNIL